MGKWRPISNKIPLTMTPQIWGLSQINETAKSGVWHSSSTIFFSTNSVQLQSFFHRIKCSVISNIECAFIGIKAIQDSVFTAMVCKIFWCKYFSQFSVHLDLLVDSWFLQLSCLHTLLFKLETKHEKEQRLILMKKVNYWKGIWLIRGTATNSVSSLPNKSKSAIDHPYCTELRK